MLPQGSARRLIPANLSAGNLPIHPWTGAEHRGFSATPVPSQKSVMFAYCAIILVARMAPLMVLWWMAETTADAELAIG